MSTDIAVEYETREAWLIAAAEELATLLEDAGEEMVPIRVSVGWPGGRGKKGNVVGQCWASTACADGVPQIFMSPVRGESDTQHVLGTLLHEMIHAIDDCQSGHRGRFIRVARAVGFLPKFTSSNNRTDELSAQLDEIGERLGPFPHAAIDPMTPGSEEKKKQGTRMLKLEGPCGYVVRTTQKWIDEGLPTCPHGDELVPVRTL